VEFLSVLDYPNVGDYQKIQKRIYGLIKLALLMEIFFYFKIESSVLGF
jgi:hypothetical protein